jgi:glycerol-3-phosphate dehydrogenase
MTKEATFDLLIIGGGINGAGIARDAAGRGLRVLLCEQGDLAGATSSASSKLIHGGLRYLEMGEFALVRAALAERETILRLAPHIVWPLRFVLPCTPGGRPAWMLRLGLFLYDHLGGRRTLPGTATVRLDHEPWSLGLTPGLTRGFAYSDCWVEDSRLVVLNAMDAVGRGAEVLTRTRCETARHDDGLWRVRLTTTTGAALEVTARVLVNAAGPWTGRVLDEVAGCPHRAGLRLVKGSHIVVPRLYPGPHAFILQNPDGRVVFALPFEDDFTLVGTTDLPYDGDPAAVRISASEIEYLCAAVNRVFARTVGPADVVHHFAGVRPLLDDHAASPSAVTRGYALEMEGGTGGVPPLLSVFGGKITTFRRLSEEAMERLRPALPGLAGPWTAGVPLPGGDLPAGGTATLVAGLVARYPWLPVSTARRWSRLYGTRAGRIVDGAARPADLGVSFGGENPGGLGLTEAEVRYLMDHEFARTAEDVLWRRTRLGLRIDADGAERLAQCMAGMAARQPRP